MNVRLFEAADRERWNEYVRRSANGVFGQTVAWKEITERTYGCRARWWLAEENGRVRGALPLFQGRGTLFSAPGGLLADDDTIAAALLDPARAEVERAGLRWLELRDQGRAWPGLATSEEHVTLVLDLAADAETQWKAFDAKLRNQVRKAQKSGLVARWGRDQVGDFHRVMVENMRDLGTPIRGPGYYRAVLEAFGEEADILIVRREGTPIGAMFVIGHGGTLSDPWASSLRRHFVSCPNHMLYWEAIQRAIARGDRRFDFGRSQWNSNTFRFKEQWRAVPRPLFYQYVLGRADRIPTLADQKSSFSLAVAAWKRLPVPVAARLGEPVKRLFPEAL